MNKQILRLAIPSIVANITTPLLGMIDTAITGHMGGAGYMAAVAVGGVMFNMLYWLFGFLRAGTSGLTAQACGAKDDKLYALTLYRSLIIAVGIGLLMIILQWPLSRLLIEIVGPDQMVEPLARQYFDILIWGAPATLSTFALTGWYLGMQNSKINLWTSLTINVVNIAASLILVIGLHWKVEGVAVGTLIAQWTGLITALIFLIKYKLPTVRFREIFRWNEIIRFFKINTLIMARTVLLISVTVWFTRVGAMQGPVMLAVNTILMQLFMLFSYVMDGFAYAGEALIGKFSGSKEQNLHSRCVTILFRWGWGLSLLFTCIYLLTGQGFLNIMSDDQQVIHAASEYWWWAATIPLAGFAGFIWDGIYIGSTDVSRLFWAMLIATVIFFTTYFIAFPIIGNHGIWLAFILYLTTRGVVQWILYSHK